MPRVTPAASPRRPAIVPLARVWARDVGDYVSAGEVSRDGRWCAVGLGDGRLLGIALDSGRELFCREAHPGGVLELSLAPDGGAVATCGQDAQARVWGADGTCLRDLPGGGSAGWVEHVAWAPSGDYVATAAGRTVRVWARAGGAPRLEPAPLASTVSGLAWSADSVDLAAAGYGGVRVWRVGDGAPSRFFPWKGSLVSMAWSPDGAVIACGSQDNSVHFWRLATGQDSEMRGYPCKPRALAWDRASTLLATAGAETVTLWDFTGDGPEGTRPLQLRGHRGVCTRLAFSPRDGTLASGGRDSAVLVWHPRRTTRPLRVAFLDDEITVLAWHPAASALLGGDAKGNLALWASSG